MDVIYFDNIFPESLETQSCFEGAKITISVNKYERSSIARNQCIDFHGCYCHACNLDFKKVYGELGNNFIHVHHLKPLHEINREYVVDPIIDLIPVCPNCHAMLHRKINGLSLNIDQLKDLVNK